MIRQLMGLPLLHHIENVCKPSSTVKQAANAAVGQIIAGIASAAGRRDREATVQRARERQEAAIERAHRIADARHRRSTRPVADQHKREPAVAIDPPRVVPGWWAPYMKSTQEADRI